MQIGDVTSNERGSGARFNTGKVRLDYVPARVLSRFYTGHERDIGSDGTYADMILDAIAEFEERTPDGIVALNRALTLALRDSGGIDRWRDVCAVFDFGAQKYAPWNWAKGMAWSIPLACIKRHAVKILEGEKLDDESGLSHFGHIGCNLVMLLHYVRNYAEGDDRPARECFEQPTEAELELGAQLKGAWERGAVQIYPGDFGQIVTDSPEKREATLREMEADDELMGLCAPSTFVDPEFVEREIISPETGDTVVVDDAPTHSACFSPKSCDCPCYTCVTKRMGLGPRC